MTAPESKVAAPVGGLDVLAVPKMPGPAFRLLWNGIRYTVSKPGIGATDVYTAAQVRAFGRECLRSHGEAIAELIEAVSDVYGEPDGDVAMCEPGCMSCRIRAALAKVASNGDTK